MENEGPPRDRLQQTVIVGGHEHRRSLVVDIAQKAQQLSREIGVEVPGGLVGEDETGLIGQRACDGHPLLFAPRQSLGKGRLTVMQAESLQNVIGPAMGLPGGHAVEAEHEGDVLQNRLSLQELEILENHANLAPQCGESSASDRVDPLAGHPDLSGGGFLGSVEEAEQSGLAGARRTGHKDELASLHLQVETAENLAAVVLLVDVSKSYHGLGSSTGVTANAAPGPTVRSGAEIVPLGHFPGGGVMNSTPMAEPREVQVASERALVLADRLAAVYFGVGPARGETILPARVERLLSALGPEVEAVRWAHQLHGSDVAVVSAPWVGGAACIGSFDALATVESGVALQVWTADCVPVVLVGPNAIAVAHAGWRGCVAGIVRHTVERLASHLGSPARELRAYLGPSISAAHYQVGSEVIEGLESTGIDRATWLEGDCVDLRKFLTEDLRRLGVRGVQSVGPCTFASPQYASYRRDGDAAGRQWSLVYRAKADDSHRVESSKLKVKSSSAEAVEVTRHNLRCVGRGTGGPCPTAATIPTFNFQLSTLNSSSVDAGP